MNSVQKMPETQNRICRFYNSKGCRNAENCQFVHAANSKPPCKYYMSATGCRYGDICDFSHDIDRAFSYEGNNYGEYRERKEMEHKESMEASELTGTNNNNMEHIVGSNNSNFQVSSSNSEICSNNEIREPKDNELQCGTCKRILPRGSSTDSYCTILRDHYLESFLEKEGEHIKMVKMRASLDIGQMYWCKSCILIFEKPWSLFQHVADKAKGIKVQKWDKKAHLDWLETVAALLAGLDLGLFTASKIRNDLRNLLADQHSFEEELEEAALTAAAFMQFLNPMAGLSTGSSNSMAQSMAMNSGMFGSGGGGGGGGGMVGMNPMAANRFQQRDMMRRLEQFNRQIHRKQFNAGGYNRFGTNFNAPFGGVGGGGGANFGHRQGKVFSDGSFYPSGRTTHSEVSIKSQGYVPAGLKEAVISAVTGAKNNTDKSDNAEIDKSETDSAETDKSEVVANSEQSIGQKLQEINISGAEEA